MAKTLDFSTNWNGKLHCGIFHTLRRSGRFEVGDIAEVTMKDKYLGAAECIQRIRYSSAEDIPETICFLDTGYGKQETLSIIERMYSDTKGEDKHLVGMYGYLFKWRQVTTEQKQLKKTVQLAMAI